MTFVLLLTMLQPANLPTKYVLHQVTSAILQHVIAMMVYASLNHLDVTTATNVLQINAL
jgi:type III secretory pathway component EscU